MVRLPCHFLHSHTTESTSMTATSSSPTSTHQSWWRSLRLAQPSMPWHTILAASIGGALTIAVLGAAGEFTGTPLLIAAFGSSCVLVFLLPQAPLSQPLNVVGGHCVAALCGLLAHVVLPTAWWSLGLAVGVAMAAMAALRVIHPPAGGTPIAIMLTHEGWEYLFTPVLLGALVLTTCALTYRWILKRLSLRAAAKRAF